MSVDLRVLDDPMAGCVQDLERALAAGGPVVLTGGSTVKAYSKVPAAAWSGAQLWFTDERCVPVTDERSNYGAFAAALGSALDSVAYCERFRGEDGPEAAAAAYEQAIRARRIDEFELIVLGLGPDGHICSMFPGQDTLVERQRMALGVQKAALEPFVPRATLTFPALSLAKRVVVVAAGVSKADAVSAAFAEDAPASQQVPASLLTEYCEEIVVLLDDDAAARL